jgi:hypothetical protein
MSNLNPNCCGDKCRDNGEVRVYPIGGGANLILCRECFAHENAFNARRGRDRNPDAWPMVNWHTAEVYENQ